MNTLVKRWWTKLPNFQNGELRKEILGDEEKNVKKGELDLRSFPPLPVPGTFWDLQHVILLACQQGPVKEEDTGIPQADKIAQAHTESTYFTLILAIFLCQYVQIQF